MKKSKREFLSNSFHLNRKKNYFLVLNIIKKYSSITKSEIANITGLTYPTISSIIEELREKGLVKFGKKQNSSMGRKPRSIEFRYNAGLIVGIEIGLGFYGILTDLNGNIITRKKISLTKNVLDIKKIQQFIENLIKNNCDIKRIAGIGIGVAGLVTKEGEYLGRANQIKIPIKKSLEEKFSVPVFVENDADTGMIAEHQLGVAKEVKNAIYILKRERGLGFGILVNGEIMKGHNGFAGENFGIISEKVITDLEKNKITTPLIEELIQLIGLFDPEMIIMGGELSDLKEEFVEELEKKIEEYENINRKVKIKRAKIGKESVVLGAVNSVLKKIFSLSLH